MLLAGALQQVDQYWASQLSISPDLLHSQALVVMPLPAPSASSCFVFQHQAFTCVRVPPYYDDLHQTIKSQEPPSLLAPAWWQHAIAIPSQHAIGPAYLGYADAQQFRPHIAHPARLLTSADSAALAAFASAVGPLAWEHSGLGKTSQQIAACWEDDRIVAAAGYTVWGVRLAHIGVTTHPVVRGKGYGRTVVSVIGQHALEHGYVLQYRTLQSNSPSLAIAAALGFQAYATTLVIAFETVPST